MDGTDWTVMGLWMLLAIVALGVLLFLLARWMGSGAAAPAAPTTSARDLLDQRLARGEITIDEYRQRRAAIDNPARSAP